MLVNIRGRDMHREERPSEGPNESSPVQSAGLAFRKSDPSRPVRHSQDAASALRAMARPQYEGRAIAKRRRDEGGTGRSRIAYAPEAAYESPGAKRFYRPWPRKLISVSQLFISERSGRLKPGGASL